MLVYLQTMIHVLYKIDYLQMSIMAYFLKEVALLPTIDGYIDTSYGDDDFVSHAARYCLL